MSLDNVPYAKLHTPAGALDALDSDSEIVIDRKPAAPDSDDEPAAKRKPDRPAAHGFGEPAQKLAVKFNRAFYAMVRKRQEVMTEFARNTHNVGADLKQVRLMYESVLNDTQVAVLARHHKRPWKTDQRKNAMDAIKRGCDTIDAALDRVAKVRSMANDCEAALRESRDCMTKMIDSYAELEARFSRDAGK